MNAFRRALGNPTEFIHNMSALASDFRVRSGAGDAGLRQIRKFVADRNYELTNDSEAFRAALAAFAELLAKRQAQTLKIKGIFAKRLVVQSQNFSCELVDLFYRCVFEGLDLNGTPGA